MRPVKVRFRFNNGKCQTAVRQYVDKLLRYGFEYSYTDHNGAVMYHHHDLDLNVIVSIA